MSTRVDISVDLVVRLLAAQYPQWASLPLAPVPSAGTDNALYRLGADMVVRLPRIDWAVIFIPYYLHTNPVGVSNARHMLDEVLREAR